jgi:hypothetical protein
MRFLIILLVSLAYALNAQPAFEAQTIDSTISIGYGLAIGDVDGDAKPDILLADKKQIVWYRNGDWKKFVLAENLTQFDNVCIAARDIDGDGKVEIAVGAQWNPGETSDTTKSGSVHVLMRPADPTQKWDALELHHEPTVHRMRWVFFGKGEDKDHYRLVVVPLHGRGNVNGKGKPARVIAYQPPNEIRKTWYHSVIDKSMHLTHNLDLAPPPVAEVHSETMVIAGKEGVKIMFKEKGYYVEQLRFKDSQFGEVRMSKDGKMIVGIEPMHGNQVTAYTDYYGKDDGKRTVVDSTLNQGHALALADVLGLGEDQIIAGWREPNAEKKTGIKIYVQSPTGWQTQWLDENGIACEDLVVADLNGDNKPEVIAAGRATKNVKVYWNTRK